MTVLAFRRQGKRPETVAVLDLGTDETTCFIGKREPDFGVRLIGAGAIPSEGLKAGVVVDMAQAETCIRQAIQTAERAAGVAVQAVSVNVSTRSLKSRQITVQTPFASGEVAERDQKRVIDRALMELDQPEHAIVHAIPLAWWVDGEKGIRNPQGMFGQTLGVDMHFVLADLGPLRNLAHCVERSHVRIESVTVSPYAAGLAVLTEDERDLGSTVIDMGSGITTAAIFRDNALIHVEAVSFGGQNVTADLAVGLSTPYEAAERIKRIYGSALEGVDDAEYMVPCPPMGAQDLLHNEPRSRVTKIIRARVEETLGQINQRLVSTGLSRYAGRNIILTGGGAELNGIREFSERIFDKRARIGHPNGVLGLDDSLSGPKFAVAAGLLKRAFMEPNEAISGPPDLSGRRYRQRRYAGGGLGRSVQWLKENF